MINTQQIDSRKIEQERLRRQIATLVDQYAALEFSQKIFEY